MKRFAAMVCAALATGCASNDFGDNGNGNGNGTGCEMVILPFEPAEPVRGETVVARGDIATNGLGGIFRYEWAAAIDGQLLDVERRGDESIALEPLRAGVYDVELRGSVGGEACLSATRTLNVRELGADSKTYRLRVVPAAGGVYAEREVRVFGGADYDLGPIVLDESAALDGRALGPDGPISGYVRVRGAGGATSEGFADDEGRFRVARPFGGGPYDVLVVPDTELAPARVSGLSGADLGDIPIDAGIEIAGAVDGPEGAPVVGARVSLTVDGVPSTVGETDGDGAFSLLARAGDAVVRVSAPALGGLFDLRAELEIEEGDSLFIEYAPSEAPVTASPQLTRADGATSAPGAQVIWIADEVENAGIVETAREVASARGSARRSARADGEGVADALELPRGSYEVIVAPAADEVFADAARALGVDLENGPPSSLALSVPAEIGGATKGTQGGLEGVKVVASPSGSLARVAGASATVHTGEGGAFFLPVAGGADYELSLVPPPTARYGRAWLSAAAPGPGEDVALGDVELPEAIAVFGELTRSGAGPLPGAHVSLFCVDCDSIPAEKPVAEAVSDPTGRFRLLVPDPGVSGEP